MRATEPEPKTPIARLVLSRSRRGAGKVGAALALLAGCGGAPAPSAPTTAGLVSEPRTAAPVPHPAGPMHLDEARRYVLALVDHDRAEAGLAPVQLDETASRAGQGHADDMAARGFTAHLGSDGSVPEQRYTAAGGRQMVMENVGCFADGLARRLDKEPVFTAEGLEKIERAFMDEVPPHDGHRRNILTAWHTSVGIGLTQTAGLDLPCMAQEFVDDLGEYDDLPRHAKVGAHLAVGGRVRDPARIAGIGVARIDTPRPKTPAELNRTHSYAIPKPFATYFPRGYKTPIPLEVQGNAFRIEVPLTEGGRPGLYGVSVWAKLPGSQALQMISLRTIAVD
jgi:uncharacterized protein YkwD